MRFIALFFASLFLATSAFAAPSDVAKVNRFLNSLTTMQANFTQRNNDGSRTSGTLYINMPGKMRMEYKGRRDPLIIIGGQSIAVYDGERDRSAEVYPLNKTPLWILLQRNTDISRSQAVQRVWEQNGVLFVSVWDPNTPEAGQIVFHFDPNTIQLRGWTSYPSSQEVVQVSLSNVRYGVGMSNILFSRPHEDQKRRQRR